jgi:uroporphyrinogen-III synthase
MTGDRISDELLGYTVGVTADRRSGDLIAALVRRGAEVVHAPTLRIVAAEHDDHLLADTRAVIAARPECVLATTSHGFRAWMEAADAAGLGAQLSEVLTGAAIMVRGPKARGAVRAAGLTESGSGAEETTAALVDLAIARGVAGRTVAVQLHGYVDHDQLGRLSAAGARVLTVAPYRWAPPADPRPTERLIEAIVARQVDAVTFTSAPAADALLQAARRIGRTVDLLAALDSEVLPVAVGPVTADPLRRAGLKPVHPDRYRLGALVRTVTEELRSRSCRAESSAGIVELRGRLVAMGGRQLLLPPSGALIMKALVRAQGAVVPKSQLSSLVGNDDHALEVAIGRLRGALATPGLVTTVVRRGYRLG